MRCFVVQRCRPSGLVFVLLVELFSRAIGLILWYCSKMYWAVKGCGNFDENTSWLCCHIRFFLFLFFEGVDFLRKRILESLLVVCTQLQYAFHSKSRTKNITSITFHVLKWSFRIRVLTVHLMKWRSNLELLSRTHHFDQHYYFFRRAEEKTKQDG